MTGTPLRSIGRYDLLEIIGRGGAAVVYLAVQRDLGRQVALKELAPVVGAADPSFAQRFSEESVVTGSLSHPNIVTVFEYLEHEGVPYIAMEYLAQGSLRAWVGRLTAAQIAGVLEGVLAGLAHGHSRSVVHRDLKPENLLVTADGRVKIADFGVARAYADAVTRAVVTETGTTIGTPAYMSPEQALGGSVGPAADLYSLGIVAWELLAGRVPFEERDAPVAVLYRHVHAPVPPVTSAAPDVDPRIEAWLERMLEKDPADRFPSAEAAWEALEDVVLDLLGPRWRRDARLPVVDAEVAGRPLTPAVFGDGAALGGRATVHRPARRHDLEVAEGAPEPPKRTLRRVLVAAALLGVIAGAALAGVLASGGNGGRRTAGTTPSAPKTTTRTRPPTVTIAKPKVVATAIAPVVEHVLTKLDADLARMENASVAKQRSITPASQRVYLTAIRELAMQPAAITDAPLTRSVVVTFQRLDRDFGSLLAAERTNNGHRYALARAETIFDEVRLNGAMTDILKATDGLGS
jgi:hypothetical protein